MFVSSCSCTFLTGFCSLNLFSQALDENCQDQDHSQSNDDHKEKPFIATPIYDHHQDSSASTVVTEDLDTSFIQGDESILDVSLSFHDYCVNPVPPPCRIR